jgi:hypothetical protein
MTSTAVSVKLGFTPIQACDTIPDSVMAEIVRRLTFEATIGGGLGIPYYSPTAPIDKSRPWIVTNSAGLPTGKIKIYNFNNGQWEDAPSEEADAPREMVTVKKSISVSANGSYVVQWDEKFEDADYQASVVATSSQGNARFYKSAQTDGTTSIIVENYNVAFTVEVTATGFLFVEPT